MLSVCAVFDVTCRTCGYLHLRLYFESVGCDCVPAACKQANRLNSTRADVQRYSDPAGPSCLLEMVVIWARAATNSDTIVFSMGCIAVCRSRLAAGDAYCFSILFLLLTAGRLAVDARDVPPQLTSDRIESIVTSHTVNSMSKRQQNLRSFEV